MLPLHRTRGRGPLPTASILPSLGATRELGRALLQELAHRRVALEADGLPVRLRGGIDVAAARQQVGACRPVRLVVGEAHVARQRTSAMTSPNPTETLTPVSAHSASYSRSIAGQSAAARWRRTACADCTAASRR